MRWKPLNFCLCVSRVARSGDDSRLVAPQDHTTFPANEEPNSGYPLSYANCFNGKSLSVLKYHISLNLPPRTHPAVALVLAPVKSEDRRGKNEE